MRRGLLLMLALVLALPAVALASGEDVVRDCGVNGRLTRTYSLADLRAAPSRLTDTDREYSNCPGVIAAALRAASVRAVAKKTRPTAPDKGLGAPAGTGPTRGGGGTPLPPSSSTAKSKSKSPPDASTIPRVDRGPSRRHPAVLRSPGAGSAPLAASPAHASRSASGLDALPTPLLVLLVALVGAAVAGAGLSLRGRLGGERRWSDVLRRGA